MKEIKLSIMTREQCHLLYQNWENDEMMYMDMTCFKPYVYRKNQVDKYYTNKQFANRVLFAILLEDKPIGEIQLKEINRQKKECTLSIHMKNDSVKNKGYGQQAERLALEYAFNELGMIAVNADSVVKNVRSQHVLEKVGFCLIDEDNTFKYYRCEKSTVSMNE